MNTLELIVLGISLVGILMMLIAYRRHISYASDETKSNIAPLPSTSHADVIEITATEVSEMAESVVITPIVEAPVKKPRKPRTPKVVTPPAPPVEVKAAQKQPTKRAAPVKAVPKKEVVAPSPVKTAPKKRVAKVAPSVVVVEDVTPPKKVRKPRAPKTVFGD